MLARSTTITTKEISNQSNAQYNRNELIRKIKNKLAPFFYFRFRFFVISCGSFCMLDVFGIVSVVVIVPVVIVVMTVTVTVVASGLSIVGVIDMFIAVAVGVIVCC